MSFVRVEGLKYNINFGGRGGNTKGEEKGVSTMQKGAILLKCLNIFVPHCILQSYNHSRSTTYELIVLKH